MTEDQAFKVNQESQMADDGGRLQIEPQRLESNMLAELSGTAVVEFPEELPKRPIRASESIAVGDHRTAPNDELVIKRWQRKSQ